MKPATLCRLQILFLIVEIKTQTVKYCKISTYMINATLVIQFEFAQKHRCNMAATNTRLIRV